MKKTARWNIGCDIHPFIEVRRRAHRGRRRWHHYIWRPAIQPWDEYSSHPLYLPRDYDLFALLADVRNDVGIRPIAKPRGLPPEVSRGVLSAYTLRVVADKNVTDNTCRRADAERWVQQGSSTWVGANRVTHPDWHSASYLTLQELLTHDYAEFEDNNSYRTLVRCVSALATLGSPDDVRLVFWFDN